MDALLTLIIALVVLAFLMFLASRTSRFIVLLAAGTIVLAALALMGAL